MSSRRERRSRRASSRRIREVQQAATKQQQQAPSIQGLVNQGASLYSVAAKQVERTNRKAAELFRKIEKLYKDLTILDDKILDKIMNLDSDTISLLIVLNNLSDFLGWVDGFSRLYGFIVPFSIGKSVLAQALKEKGMDPSLSEKASAYMECGFHIKLQQMGIGYSSLASSVAEEISKLRCDNPKDVIRLIEILTEIESELDKKASRSPLPGVSEVYRYMGRGTGLLKSTAYLAQEVIQSGAIREDQVKTLEEIVKQAEKYYKMSEALVDMIKKSNG